MVLMGIVMCVAVVTGIFYWNAQNQEPEAIGSPSDYVVVEQEEEQEQGRYVENEKAGLKVRIPDGWTEEKMDVMEGSMVFYSPDMESMREGTTNPPLKRGCIIEVAVAYKNITIDELKEEINDMHDGLRVEIDEIETTELNGVVALKNIFDCIEFGYSVNLYPVFEDKFYGFSVCAAPEDIEKCSQEFDGFLENIVIE